MEMVTRYAGEAHITAEGWGDLNRGIVGTESYALPMGRAFEADLVSNNLLKIYDGCGVMQGREVRIPAGQSEEVTIENGTQGEKRIDLVVERYSKNEDTKIESSETILIKGTPSETDPQVPDHIEGDIRAGDMTADWPLYEVELDGINVVAVRPVFGILMNMADLKEAISDLSSNSYKLHTGLLGGVSTRPYVLKKYNDGTFELCGNLDASAVRLQYSNSSKVYFTTISAQIPEELTIDLDKRTQFSGSVESEGIYHLSVNELTATTLTVYLSAMNYISEIPYVASGFTLKGWWK